MAARGTDDRVKWAVIAVLGAVGVWYLLQRGSLSRDSLLLFAVLIPSVILHEVSHGVVALIFGDDTAKRAGRLTLNPVRHIDPFGTIILPALLVLTHAGAFGYAKPVPVSVNRLRNPRNHGFLVSVVGPVTNLFLMLLAVLVLRLFLPDDIASFHLFGLDGMSMVGQVLFLFGYINVVLAAFNLIPIPPLDGSAFLERALPRQWWPGYLQFRQYSMLLLFVLVFWAPQLLDKVFDPALRLFGRLLG